MGESGKFYLNDTFTTTRGMILTCQVNHVPAMISQ